MERGYRVDKGRQGERERMTRRGGAGDGPSPSASAHEKLLRRTIQYYTGEVMSGRLPRLPRQVHKTLPRPLYSGRPGRVDQYIGVCYGAEHSHVPAWAGPGSTGGLAGISAGVRSGTKGQMGLSVQCREKHSTVHYTTIPGHSGVPMSNVHINRTRRRAQGGRAVELTSNSAAGGGWDMQTRGHTQAKGPVCQ